MAVIRQANAVTLAKDAVVLDLGDLVRQGEHIKAAARAQADRIVADAKRERERLISDAQEIGRRAGEAAGLEQGRAAGIAEGRAAALSEFRERLSKLDENWTTAMTAFHRDRDTILLEAREDVLSLALALGERIVKKVIEVDREVVRDQLAAVLAQIAHPTRVTVRVHPADRSIVQEALPALMKSLGPEAHAELMDDGSLAPGSVVARTASGGEVDGSIGTQLQRIADALLPGGPRRSEAS